MTSTDAPRGLDFAYTGDCRAAAVHATRDNATTTLLVVAQTAARGEALTGGITRGTNYDRNSESTLEIRLRVLCSCENENNGFVNRIRHVMQIPTEVHRRPSWRAPATRAGGRRVGVRESGCARMRAVTRGCAMSCAVTCGHVRVPIAVD